jgi:hypothetical protein
MRKAIVLVLVGAGLWAGWRLLFPSDEAQIRALLDRVGDTLSSAASEGDVARLARVASLREELAPNVTVDAGPPFKRVTGREALIGALARMRGTLRNVEVTFPDVSVAVAPDRQTAVAVVAAEAQFEDAGGRRNDARELDVEFARTDGRWVIAAVTGVSPLRRLQ